jgi:CsoR family transcriptional regulator, copper-sensing transcriptional repressor
MIKDLKTRSQHRIKIITGQLNGLQKMIEQEDYCVDILTQSLAIQRSLRSLNKLILENHLQTHVSHDLASTNTAKKEKALKELLDLYELTNVRGK